MHDRAQNVARWHDDELYLILLRQFKRLLADQEVDFSDADLRALAVQMAQRQVDPATGARLRTALSAIVQASIQVLQIWNLTYAQSLETRMDQLPGWETTADFLELANTKGNAELRISTGAALLLALGDRQFADQALACYRHGMDDREDVDAMIAKRALSFASGIPFDASDWQQQIEAWLNGLSG